MKGDDFANGLFQDSVAMLTRLVDPGAHVAIYETEDPSDQVQRRSRVAGWLMLGLTGAIVLGLSFFPAPYVIDNPGPTYDTLGSVSVGDEDMELILISGEDTFDSTGSLLLTTVTRSGNPEACRVGWMFCRDGLTPPHGHSCGCCLPSRRVGGAKP